MHELHEFGIAEQHARSIHKWAPKEQSEANSRAIEYCRTARARRTQQRAAPEIALNREKTLCGKTRRYVETPGVAPGVMPEP